MVKRVQCFLKRLLIATCVVIVPALAHSTTTLSALVAAGPIANWKFDETSGQPLIDSSGNGNTGYLGTNSTVETSDPTRTLGKVNNALKFDGIDDLATISNTAALNTLLSFTYSAWIYPTGSGANGLGRIIAKESSTKLDDFYFHVDSFYSNTLDANLFNTAGTGFKSLAAANALTFNTWQHVAVTYNDTGDRKLHLFLNGTEVTYQRQDTLTGMLKLTPNPLSIGNRPTKDRTFQGNIDQVAVYNRALSAAEIQTLYNPSASSFDFALTNGGSKSVTQGAAVSTTTSATLVSGTTQSVSFSAAGLPTGTTAAFSSTACSPTCSTGLTLSTTTSTPTGTYTITVTGTGGGVTKTTSFALTVNPASTAFNFSLTNGGSKSVTQGAAVSTTTSATLVSGTAQSVAFSVSGLPSGVITSFSSASCTPTCSTSLTISTLASTPAGTYTITVTGTGGGVTKTTSFSLTVNPASTAFNFSLTNGGSKSVTQGAAVSTTTSATLVSGTTQAVSFSAAGLPTGATAAFSSTACSPTCSTTLTLSTVASTPIGAFTITVTGTGGSVTKTTSFILTVSSTLPTLSCLQGTGPLLTVSGVRTSQYENQSLAANTRIDASTAQFLTTAWAPVRLGGGSNGCFSGGEVIGQLPPSTSWSIMHDVTGMYVTNSSLLHIENTRLFDYGDSLSMASAGLPNWSIKGVYAKYMRDDCVEDDFLYSGTIDDSLFDGCYDGISAQTWSGQSPDPGDGSNNLIVMKNSLLRLQAMDAAYSGPLPNHNSFWKWDPKAPKVALYNNIFRADEDSWETGSGAQMWMGPPPGKLADCENNLMVWLGAGNFNDELRARGEQPLPATFNGKPCFTITTDKSVWDNAVAQWKANHPTTLNDVGAPIVSLFSPGTVGSRTLTGTVTLTATAVDDREVGGVQFKLNGQNLGGEVTSESSPTKFKLTWDSHTKANGTYTLTATARDAAGNTKTATGVTVTISN